MRPTLIAAACLVLQVAASPALAAEPLLGTWRLNSQEVNGENSNFEPLTLRVSASGDMLAFAFSVPVNGVYFVSMSYTLKLDGSEADVKDAQGQKVGTIRMKPAGPSHYKLVLQGPNRPDSLGQLSVSPDGKTLASEADAMRGGHAIHSRQTFTRY